MVKPLQRTIFASKDISEQPDSEYILVLGSGDRRGYYACDAVEHGEGVVSFFQGADSKLVYMCRVDGAWNVLRRDLMEPITEEQLIRRTSAEHAAAEAISRELHPDEHKVIDAMVEKARKEHTEGVSGEDVTVRGIPLSTGQYV